MKMEQVNKLDLALYVLIWKESAGGGRSLASVGQLHDGSRWFACCNWTGKDTTGICSTKWEDVKKAVKVFPLLDEE